MKNHPNIKWLYICFTFIILFFILLSGLNTVAIANQISVSATSISTIQALIIDPSPIPNWISSVKPFPGETGPFDNRLCVEIKKFWLWEPGDYEETSQPSFNSRLHITIDNLDAAITDVETLDNSIPISDNKGDVIGTVSVWAFTCVITDLKVGDHMASVTFVTTAGTKYSYTWTFRINSTNLDDYSTAMQSTSIISQITATAERKFYVITETKFAELSQETRNQIVSVTKASRNATSTAITERIMETLVALTATSPMSK